MRKNNSGAGVHTVIFSIKRILDDTLEEQRILTPRIFGRKMKGWSVHDRRNVLTRQELIAYRSQLVWAKNHWEIDDEWICEEPPGNEFRLKFIRREMVAR